MPSALRASSISMRLISRSGRIMLPFSGFMPPSPLIPLPLISWKSTVSAWSSLWCATAVLLYPSSFLTFSKHSYLYLRPASSSVSFRCAAIALMSLRNTLHLYPSPSTKDTVYCSSLSASSPLMPWFTCTAQSPSPYSPASFARTVNKNTESAPPETPATILSPYSNNLFSSINFLIFK